MTEHSLTIINSDKVIPSFNTKKDLRKYISISGVINDHENHYEYEYSNGYYTLHFPTIEKLLEFLSLEDL